MQARLRSHLTFANVVALMALFIAMSGGAYALSVPKDSVGAKQIAKSAVGSPEIKRGAVRSPDVKDDSLLAVDFKAGQLPAGPPGPTGPVGATGPAGPSTGPAGGGLTGSYPNPQIASSAVGTSQVQNFGLNDEDISQGTFVNFAATVGTVLANSCTRRPITGVNAAGDHLLLTPDTTNSDARLSYTVEYGPVAAYVKTCNSTNANADDGTTNFNLLVIDAQ